MPSPHICSFLHILLIKQKLLLISKQQHVVSTCILLRRTQTIYLQSVSCVRRTLTIYLQSVSCGLLTYLVFAWLTALTNQVIRLVGHRQFTCSLCSLTQTEAGNSNSNSGKPITLYIRVNQSTLKFFQLTRGVSDIIKRFTTKCMVKTHCL